MKCQGKVYDLERITSKSGVWHRQCFNCSGCKCNLTSTLDDAYDEQGQLYCKPCLKKNFTENIIPMTYSDPKKLPIAKDQENCCSICEGAVFEAEKVKNKFTKNSPEIHQVFHTRIHQVFHARIHQVFHTRIGCTIYYILYIIY